MMGGLVRWAIALVDRTRTPCTAPLRDAICTCGGVDMCLAGSDVIAIGKSPHWAGAFAGCVAGRAWVLALVDGQRDWEVDRTTKRGKQPPFFVYEEPDGRCKEALRFQSPCIEWMIGGAAERKVRRAAMRLRLCGQDA